jgi:predicted nucleotidyltransferase component of viral defense system
VITPEAVMFSLQSNFDDRIIKVYAYNIETLLAEKIETILRRSILNTRPRDYYDVYIIVKTQNERFDNQVLREAVQATSSARKSSAAIEGYADILKRIHDDTIMRQRWETYSKTYPYANGIEFDEVIEILIQVCSKLDEN